MKLNFPTSFEVNYPLENKRYYGEAFSQNITKALLKSSNNYCMYCGRKLVLDNEYYYNIEHSIEKDGYIGVEKPETPFLHCKYNLSVACNRCNQKYKNKMIEHISYELVNKDLNCLKKRCNEPCEEYNLARKEYLKKNKIILQPQGVKADNNSSYNIRYDLLKQIFVPNVEKASSIDIDFIQEHIARFNLNRDTASTCIINVCEIIWKVISFIPKNSNVVDVLEVLEEVHFENIIAKIFLTFIKDNFTDTNELKKFCELYMILSYL